MDLRKFAGLAVASALLSSCTGLASGPRLSESAQSLSGTKTQLIIHRHSGYTAAEADKTLPPQHPGAAHKMHISIDGQKVAALRLDGLAIVDLEPGPHTAVVEMEFTKTAVFDLSVKEGTNCFWLYRAYGETSENFGRNVIEKTDTENGDQCIAEHENGVLQATASLISK